MFVYSSMTSKATQYHKEHPKYYSQERIKDKERVQNLYHNNPEYKEKVKQQAFARYYKMKELKSSVVAY